MALLVLDGFTRGNTVQPMRNAAPLGYMNHAQINREAHPLTGFAVDGSVTTGGWQWHSRTATAFYTELYTGQLRHYNGSSVQQDLIYIGEAGDGSSSGRYHITARLRQGGVLQVYLGNFSTLIAEVPTRISQMKWYFIEFGVVIHDTTGSVQVRIDGVTVVNETNIDTNNGGTGVDFVWWWQNFNARCDMADTYVCDASGSANNSFLGPMHIETLVPNGDGNRNDWTPSAGLTNYENVDDGDTVSEADYVSSATAGDDELYTFPSMTFSPNSIFGVQVRCNVARQDAGFRELAALARDTGGTEANSAFGIPGGNLDVTRCQGGMIFEQNPNGPADWTTSSFNSAEFGLTLVT